MRDIEINKALAIAIGWKPERIIEYEGQDYIGLPVFINRPAVKLFSYEFWNVIGPIAEKFDAFPFRVGNHWVSEHCASAETPQKAIALAVIGGVK